MEENLFELMELKKGHFKLESGYHSELWFHLDSVFRRTSQVQPFIHHLKDKLAKYELDGVCGPLVGGAFLAQLVAAQLDTDFYYAERFMPTNPSAFFATQYHIPVGLRQLVAGKRLAIVDDVISAGSAVRGTFIDLQSCGAVPVVVGTLLLLSDAAPQYFAQHHISVEAVEQMDYVMWPPADCPHCANQVPLEDFTPDRIA